MKDLPCQKRRHIIQNKDGSRKKIYRCANGAAKNYRDGVNESVCKNCVLRQPLLRIAPTCKEYPPIKPIWPEPYYGENGDIIYPFQDGIQQPPTPEGYKLGAEDWWFINEWHQCPYRQMMNRRTPQGDLQINAYCTVRTNRAVKYEECKQCSIDVTKISGKRIVKSNIPLPESIKKRLEKNGIPNYPKVNEMLDNYWKAVKQWIAAGRPIRKDIEIRKIYENFCLLCDWYDTESQRCKGCGCKVKPKGIALLNKIKMKTEHCPRGFW